MTSTPYGDPAGHHHHRRSAAPVRTVHRRRRATTRTLLRGRAFSARPAALWPFAVADPLPGTARLAGWLGRVVVTLVTGYTRPGDRVLLLAPPPPPRPQSSVLRGARDPDPYAGLTEAVWTLIRLGRGVDTATAAPTPDFPTAPVNPTRRDRAESGPGPRPTRAASPTPTDRHHEFNSHRVRAEPRPGDQFDLIITAVHPHDTDWLAHTNWNAILTPTGMLAAITHSDSRRGRLLDPISAVVGTFRSGGWRWHDHIAVLTEPLPTPASTAATAKADASPVAARAVEPAATLTVSRLPNRLTHHDLLLFVSAPSDPQPDRDTEGDIG